MKRSVLDGLILLAVIPVLAGFAATSDSPQSPILGPPEIVFDWSRDKCETTDLPDTGASAFRDASGRVQLHAAHYVWRRSVGPDLDHVTHECRVVNAGVGTHNPDPSMFDDWIWMRGAYTANGRDLYTLTHNEYHGEEHGPQWCPSMENGRCAYLTTGLAESHDGGDTWTRRAPPTHLVAVQPRTYLPDYGGFGMYGPTNIVRVNVRVKRPKRKGTHLVAYYYAAVAQVGLYIPPEYQGTCVMRTRNLADPTSWRAWDGKGFTHRFFDPWRTSVDRDHFCTILPFSMDFARIVYSTHLRKWVASGTAKPEENGKAEFVYRTSSDLIHWSPKVTLMQIEETYTYQCGDPNPVAYPALLDPKSTSRTFQTIGHKAYLYYTQLNYANCQMTLDRDLLRVPVEIG